MLLPAALLLLGAAPPAPPDELLRQGNRAFELGDYPSAADLYARALERAEDPGLAAFNLATALYHRRDWREAELYYRRCLDDRAVPQQRRARAYYNLGNCLLAQAGPDDLPRLRAAVTCFRRSLDAGPNDPALEGDARHNLELAKLLWADAAARAADPPSPGDEPEDPSGLPDPQPPGDRGPDGFEPGGASADPSHGRAQPLGAAAPKDGDARPAAEQTPGAGNLPVLPDTEELTPLTPEQVSDHLRRTAVRLQRERRNLSRGNSGAERPDVRNW